MGGRGGSFRKKNLSANSKPSYFAETEKAVKLKIAVEDSTLEKTLTREVWIPKSQLSDDGRPGQWITDQKAQEFYSNRRAVSEYTAKWKDANGKEFLAGKTQREQTVEKNRKAAFEAGKASYNELLAYAKRNGVKGVRVGMKRTTIEKKIRDAGK